MFRVQEGNSRGCGYEGIHLELIERMVFVVIKPPWDNLQQVGTERRGGELHCGFLVVSRSFAFASFNVCSKLSGKHESKIDLLGVVFESLPRL